jgi:hypothetical protein
MTSKTQKWDSIDDELARAYFNPTEPRRGPVVNSLKKPGRSFPVRKTATVLSALIAAGLAFLLAVKIITELEASSFFRRESQGRNSLSSARDLAPVLYREKVLYDFESGNDGWEIPAWAFDKEDHRQISAETSTDIASAGEKSLRVNSNLIPGNWSASLVEIQHYLDLSAYGALAVDIYIPPDAPPRGLRAKLILTVGEDWKFVEMSRSVKLEPGKWTYILASLEESSRDWKWTKVDNAFKEDVRKVSLRVEYSGKQEYSGPIYVDNFRVGDLEDKKQEN